MRAPLVALLAAVLASGCVGQPEVPAGPAADQVTSDFEEEALFANFTGRLTGLPVQPAEEDFPVEVPKGAIALEATVDWTSDAADLRLVLLDPAGEEVETSFPEGGRASAATLEPPASGTWTVRVRAMRAVDEAFTLTTRVLLIEPSHNVLEQTYEIGGASLFKEINVIMEEDASFAWTFTATSPVHWDIHSHENGETTYHEEGTSTGESGDFTAPKRQIYSVLFAPPDTSAPAPATVEFRMEGAFRVHSHSQ